MIKKKVFIACDTKNSKELNKIIHQSKTNKLEVTCLDCIDILFKNPYLAWNLVKNTISCIINKYYFSHKTSCKRIC